MTLPKIGFRPPTFGRYAGPDSLVQVAQAVEEAGFHSVAASERLLLPARADWDNDAGLPQSHVWEPLEMLTWVAAHTRRIRIVTGIVNAIFQPPIVLARRLATLDRLSGGRLDVGIGQGGGGTPETSFRIAEEFTAAGVPLGRRGAGFVEHVAAMRACWGPDPVEFHGDHYQIPRSVVGPKPYADTIPLLFGALTRPTIERAARIGDGLITVAVDWGQTREHIQWYRQAGGVGPVVVGAMRDYPGDVDPATFIEGALEDLDRVAAIDADEVHFDLNLADVAPSRQVDCIHALAAKLDM
jgi:probable F420-dependent oxidoreductase